MTRAEIDHPKPQTRLSIKQLAAIQAYSGLLFGLFLVLHLATLSAALWGQQAYDSVLNATRNYYQWPAIEVLGVLGAGLVHAFAALARIRRRRRTQRASASKPTLRVRLHRYSGYYLLLAFGGHVVATRTPSLLGEQVDFGFLNFSLTVAPAFFYPYYALFAAAGSYHLLHGGAQALRILGVRLPRSASAARSRPFWAMASLLSVTGVVAVLALGGMLYPVDTSSFANWEAFLQRFLGS